MLTEYKIIFKREAKEDLDYFKQRDRKKLKKIFELIEDIQLNCFAGKGKPEPLKHELAGLWSRRINKEHRLVYKVENDELIIISCRYHY